MKTKMMKMKQIGRSMKVNIEYNVEIDSDAFHCELEVSECEDSSISC